MDPIKIEVEKTEIQRLVLTLLDSLNSKQVGLKFYSSATGLAFEEKGRLKKADDKFYFNYNNNVISTFEISGERISLAKIEPGTVLLLRNDWANLLEFVSKLRKISDNNDGKRIQKSLRLLSKMGFGVYSGFILEKKYSISMI